MPMSTLSPSKHTGMIRIRFIYLYCLVIVVDNDQSIFGLASPFLHKFVAFKLISYSISILLLYLNSGINSRIPSIAQFVDLAFSCLVWSCEARKVQTSIESPPEIRFVLLIGCPLTSMSRFRLNFSDPDPFSASLVPEINPH